MTGEIWDCVEADSKTVQAFGQLRHTVLLMGPKAWASVGGMRWCKDSPFSMCC